MFYEDFENKSLKIHVDEVSISPILADYTATNRIVVNIIQNGLRYAKSYLTINLIEEKEYIVLRAINDVNDFDCTELNRIFDRTFRLDTSRTGGQLGLGLHRSEERRVGKEGGSVMWR